jgi:hypothetical protein
MGLECLTPRHIKFLFGEAIGKKLFTLTLTRLLTQQWKKHRMIAFNLWTPPDWENIWLVRTTFVPFAKGREIISRAFAAGADVIIGSIIAAQAYPGDVVGMIPVPGYERVAPNEKRVLPDKFTVFPKLKD